MRQLIPLSCHIFIKDGRLVGKALGETEYEAFTKVGDDLLGEELRGGEKRK